MSDLPPWVPVFLLPGVPLERPELPADFGPGSPVMVVIPSGSRRFPPRRVPATVSTKARIWLTAEPVESAGQGWRLRADTQDDGSAWSHRTRFVTPEQDQYEQALSQAREFLQKQGIGTDYSSPWAAPARLIELARRIWPVRQPVPTT